MSARAKCNHSGFYKGKKESGLSVTIKRERQRWKTEVGVMHFEDGRKDLKFRNAGGF